MLAYAYNPVVDCQMISGEYILEYKNYEEFLKFSIVPTNNNWIKVLTFSDKMQLATVVWIFSEFPILEPYKHTISSIFHNNIAYPVMYY